MIKFQTKNGVALIDPDTVAAIETHGTKGYTNVITTGGAVTVVGDVGDVFATLFPDEADPTAPKKK